MNSQNKAPLWGAIASLVVVLAVVTAGFSNNWWTPTTQTSLPTASPVAVVTPSDSLRYQGRDNTDALTVLRSVATVETKDTNFGPMIVGINGRQAGANEYWQFLVNGESASVGAHLYVTKATDSIEWKIATF